MTTLFGLTFKKAPQKAVEVLPDPRGVLLEGKKAEKVIAEWEAEVVNIETRRTTIMEAIPNMRDRKSDLNNRIKETAGELKDAKKRYLEVKTPVAKERWARKLVLTDKLHRYLRESQNLLKLNINRAEAGIEDAVMIGRLLEEKITDAKLYYDLNGQIRLVGHALAAAENLYDRTATVEKDLEVSLEGLEQLTTNLAGKDLLLEAESIVSGGKSQPSNNEDNE